MSLFSWTTVQCVVCNRKAKKYIDLHAPWVNDNTGIKTICIGCIMKYRPTDTFIQMEHIVPTKEQSNEKYPKQRTVPTNLPFTPKPPSETG